MLASNLSVYYQNCRGLNTKCDEFCESTLNADYDIVVAVETWLQAGVGDGELVDGGLYNVVRSDRNLDYTKKSKGGGVLMAIKKKHKILNIVKHNSDFELVIVEVKVSNCKYTFCGIYIPSGSICEIYDSVFEFLQGKIANQDKFYIVGDFNIRGIHGINCNSDKSNSVLDSLNDFLDFNSFRLYNNVKNFQDRTLDLVISSENNSNKCKVARDFLPFVKEDAYHPALEIAITLDCHKKCNKYVSEESRYNFKKTDFLKLVNSVRDSDWESVLSEKSDVNVALDNFYRKLYEIIDDCVPRDVVFSNFKRFPIWFTNEIRNMLKEKKKYRKMRFISDFYRDKFVEARRALKRMIRLEKGNYIRKVERNITTDLNGFWNFVAYKQKYYSDIGTFKYNGRNIEGGETADEFANFFSSVYSSAKASYDLSFECEKNDGCNETLILNEISVIDYNSALKKLKPKKASGEDGIPPYLLKGCGEWLREPLLHIFNLIISSGTFPSLWKTSIVTPIFKSGDKMDITNYRPISIMCAPAKLFEQIIYCSLYGYVEKYFVSQQHGFIANKSISTNLFIFGNYVYETLENKSQLDTVYTDFRKAFDKVDHDVLLLKLNRFGLSGNLLKTMKSYLENRYSKVKYNGNTSGKFEANSGVPQGSNLGPLLFLIFINDLPSVLKSSECLLFADDLKIFKEIHTVRDCIKLQEDINRVYEWSLTNKLHFNVKKCLTLTIARIKNPVLFEYMIGDEILTRCDKVKDLGITYDNNFSFSHHFTIILRSANRLLGFIIRQSASFKNINSLKILYYSLIRPKLEFGTQIWFAEYHSKLVQLEKIQNKFLRYIYFKKYNKPADYKTVRTYQLRNEFELLSLENRRTLAVLTFLHKLINNKINSPEILSLVGFNVPPRKIRSFPVFNVPRMFTTRSPLVAMLRLANELNSMIDLDWTMSQSTFRTSVMRYHIHLSV